MKKIEILELAIETLKGQSDNIIETTKKVIDDNNDAMKQTIADVLDFPVKFISYLSISDYATQIYIKTSKEGFGSELTIYNPNNSNKTHRIGYLATQVDETQTQYLLYLELVGKIAKDFREGGKLIPKLVEGVKVFKDATKESDELSGKISQLQHKVRTLSEEELVESARGGVELLDSVYKYISYNDSHKSLVKSVEVVKETNKTMTLLFKDNDNNPFTRRFKLGRGIAILLYYAKLLKEQKYNKITLK